MSKKSDRDAEQAEQESQQHEEPPAEEGRPAPMGGHQYQDQRLAEHQNRATDAGANPQQAADQQAAEELQRQRQRQQPTTYHGAPDANRGNHPSSRPHPATPALGEMVLYCEAGVISAAVVTGVNPDDTVALHVFHRTGVQGTSEFDKAVPWTEGVDGWQPRPRT